MKPILISADETLMLVGRRGAAVQQIGDAAQHADLGGGSDSAGVAIRRRHRFPRSWYAKQFVLGHQPSMRLPSTGRPRVRPIP
jgi:hypothetical protein